MNIKTVTSNISHLSPPCVAFCFDKRISASSLWAALLMALCAMTSGGAAMGQDAQPLYTIEQIQVEAEVGNRSAPETRDSALADGEHLAMKLLVSRLIVPESRGRALELVDNLKPKNVRELIENYEIIREAVTARAYEGEITYHFNAESVQEFFISNGLTSVERVSPPILLIAITRTLDTLWVWEDANLLLTELIATPLNSPMVPIVLANSQADRDELTRQSLLDLDINSIQVAMMRNDLPSEIGRTVVAVLDFKASDASADAPLRLRFVELDYSGRRQRYEVEIPKAPNLEARLTAARNLAILAIEDEWKRNLPPLIAEQSVAELTIKLRNFQDWLAIRERLSNEDLFSDVRIHLVSANQAVLSVRHPGSLDSLLAGVAKSDYTFKAQDNNAAQDNLAEQQMKNNEFDPVEETPKYILEPIL